MSGQSKSVCLCPGVKTWWSRVVMVPCRVSCKETSVACSCSIAQTVLSDAFPYQLTHKQEACSNQCDGLCNTQLQHKRWDVLMRMFSRPMVDKYTVLLPPAHSTNAEVKCGFEGDSWTVKLTSHLYRSSLIISEGFKEQGESTAQRRINSSSIALQAERGPGHLCLHADSSRQMNYNWWCDLAIKYIGLCYTVKRDGTGDIIPVFPLPVSSGASVFHVSEPLPPKIPIFLLQPHVPHHN